MSDNIAPITTSATFGQAPEFGAIFGGQKESLDNEHETLIGAISEQITLSNGLRDQLAKLGNAHGIRVFEHHSKTYRDKTIDQLIELVENLHDANRAIIRKLKKLKRVKPTQEQVDALLDGRPL